MRRRVTLHGPSSLSVSLPASWVKKKGIKKGQEVEVMEHDECLLIRLAGCNREAKNSEYDFSGLTEEILEKILLAIHEKGYDECKINVDSVKKIKDITFILNRLNIGFEVLDDERHSLVIKNITHLDEEQENALFRRVFRIVVEYSKKLQAVLKKKEEITLSCLSHRNSVEKLARTVKRILLMKEKGDFVNSYLIIDALEKAGYHLGVLEGYCKYNASCKELLSVFEQTSILLSEAYDLYYNFSLEKYGAIMSHSLKVGNSIREKKKCENQKEWDHLEFLYQHINTVLKCVLGTHI